MPVFSRTQNKSLYIFRRDLRLEDNTALLCALKESESVLPAFIFDPAQADKTKNEYFSENAFGFMIDSLNELDNELQKLGTHLYVFHGNPVEVITRLIKEESISAVYVNKDYTPFSIKRDSEIQSECNQQGITFKQFADTLLNEPEDALKQDGKPYTIFTPYWKNASKIFVNAPQINNFNNYYSGKISFEEKVISPSDNALRIKGGRPPALNILKNISGLKNYETERDFPSIDGTSKLSAHLKFGTVSVREVYYEISAKLGDTHPLLRQLYWRDFFHHIAYHFPKVFGHSFNDKYENVKWNSSDALFEKWKNGTTGFPIVDAGIRELNATGYMHNRVRMVVASFLTKDLHIDWRRGEKYFAQQLVDYDPCLNNGNWQWAASTGCDAQPYFRIFNPWRQQERFDAECIYIKKWIPELNDVAPKTIHSLYKNTLNNYPQPIVEHSEESKEAIARYKAAI